MTTRNPLLIPEGFVGLQISKLLAQGKHNEAAALESLIIEWRVHLAREAQSFAETIERKANEKRLEAARLAAEAAAAKAPRVIDLEDLA
jgi:hypothetical protein